MLFKETLTPAHTRSTHHAGMVKENTEPTLTFDATESFPCRRPAACDAMVRPRPTPGWAWLSPRAKESKILSMCSAAMPGPFREGNAGGRSDRVCCEARSVSRTRHCVAGCRCE